MNTVVCAAIFVAVVVTAAEGSSGKVPLATVGSKTFYTIAGKESVTWDGAVEACSEAGLTTAVIDNKAESDALAGASRKILEEGKEHYMWLGAILKNGKWRWAASGKEVTYTNWNPDADLNNPATSPTNGYECGYITSTTWGTVTCTIEYGIPVCQSKRALQGDAQNR